MADPTHPSTPRAGGQALREVPREFLQASRELAEASLEMAKAGDRWFVLAVGAAAKEATHVRDLLSGAVERGAARLPWPGRGRSKDRLRRALAAEAKRMKFDTSGESFELFAERVAVLVELVLSGAVRVEDIAFEADASGAGEAVTDPLCSGCEVPSTDLRDEVPDDQERDQGDEPEALPEVQHPAAP